MKPLSCAPCPYRSECQSLTRHRLENEATEIDELKARYPDFRKEAQAIYTMLDQMPSGTVLHWQKLYPGKEDLFIKIACRYIIDHPKYNFSEDYSLITKDWKLC